MHLRILFNYDLGYLILLWLTNCNLISAPLQVKITPKIQSVDVGKSISLNCSVSGTPQPSIEWFHNGNSISFQNNRIRVTSKDQVIHLNSVERKDRGMYQCVARNDWDFLQDSMQLDLFGMKMSWFEFELLIYFIFPSDDPPVLLHIFNDQTLNPGQQLSLKVSFNEWFLFY